MGAKMQPEVAAVYSYIESWWGDSLSEELILRVVGAPRKQLNLWLEGWPDTRALTFESLSPLAPGAMRLNLGRAYDGFTAYGPEMFDGMQLLLYAPVVVLPGQAVDTPVAPFEKLGPRPPDPSTVHVELGADDGPEVLDTPYHESTGWELRRRGEDAKLLEIERRLRWLVALRPLVETGDVLFARTPEEWSNAGYPESLHEQLFLQIPGWTWKHHALSKHVFRQLRLIQEGLITPHAWTAAEETALRIALDPPLRDRRFERVTTLARLSMPNLRAPSQQIASIRQNDDVFAEWRTALASALDSVVSLDDDGGQRATALVRDELEPFQARVARHVGRSILSTSAHGVRKYGLASVAAGVPSAVIGDLRGAGVAAAATLGAGVTDAVIAAKRNTQSQRAIQTFLTSWRAD